MAALCGRGRGSSLFTYKFIYRPGLREMLSLREKGILSTHYFSLLLLNHCCDSQGILQDVIKKDKDSLTAEVRLQKPEERWLLACSLGSWQHSERQTELPPRESSRKQSSWCLRKGGKGHLLRRQLSLSAQHERPTSPRRAAFCVGKGSHLVLVRKGLDFKGSSQMGLESLRASPDGGRKRSPFTQKSKQDQTEPVWVRVEVWRLDWRGPSTPLGEMGTS